MSDIDSPSSTSIANPERPSKRRRVYESEASTPRESSPDELGTIGDRTGSPRRSHTRSHRDSRSLKREISDDAADHRSQNPDKLSYRYERDDDDKSDRSQRSRRRSSTPDSRRDSIVSDDVEATRPLSPTPEPRQPRKVKYRLKHVLEGHQGSVSQVRFSPDGRWVASCSSDATVRVWDATTGKLMQTLEGHIAGISTVAWSPDSQTLASGSDDKTIRLWNRANGKPYKTPLKGHYNYVFSLAFSPKGNMLVSGSFDEAVFLSDVRAYRQMRSLPAHSDPVGGVDFVRDGTLIVSCSSDGLIRLWDTATGQCLRTLVHADNAPVVSVRFSPNGKYILAWTLDGCVRLWDYVEASCKKTYQGHESKKYSIGGSFGVNGGQAFVASGSEDGCIVIWDVNSKNILQKLEGHDGVAFWVDTHPFLDMIVSGGEDGLVKIWANEDDEDEYTKEDSANGDAGDNIDDIGTKYGGQNIKQELEDTPMSGTSLENS